MKVHEIMTAHARCVSPENTLVEAAGLMRELDVGALPVCDNDRLTGMVTDRDLVLRGTADGKDPNTTAIRDVMSQGIVYVFADQDVEEAARLMEDRKIRRLTVLNREKRLVGIVSLGDIAISSNPAFSGMTLRDVSEPAQPTARQRRLAELSEPVRGASMNPALRRSAGRRGAQTTKEPRRRSTSEKRSRAAASASRQQKTKTRVPKRKTPRRSGARSAR